MLRTIRQSFRRKKHPKVPESNRPHQWQQDEEAVKEAKCSFHVKYLGSVEVQESRGMHVCEMAVKQLKAELRKKRVPVFFGRHKKKKIQAVLYVSPDSLRVVENSTKALLLDQTIEKVSFCAPDRNYDRAFSYICRDGTTKRWLCHSFFAIKESGERLSHAVGCAFAVCLEKKQKREKETGVTVTYDKNRTTFTREGSFRVQTLTEQQEKANAAKAVDPEQIQVQVHNPSAVPRPHAPLHLIRQASLRQFGTKKGEDSGLNSPFKRNYTMPVNKLPSMVNRQNMKMMNPVPEMDEPFDVSNSASRTGAVKAHKEDPFAEAPMPKMGPTLASKPANGFNEVLKPTTLPMNSQQSAAFTLQQAGFTGAGSPVRDTNPWATDARQQQPVAGDPMMVRQHQRTPSEADKWLNSVQQQTGVVAGYPATGRGTNQTDPFNWNRNNGPGFQVNL